MNLIDRFIGIFTRDKLTTHIINKNPGICILNLDDNTSNETHWVCFYYNRKQIEYFDSYGLKAPAIIAGNYSYNYNTSQYKSYGSMAFRYYCLYFIYHRYHGMSYYNIVKKFSLVHLDHKQ